jgi:hypothetical protein
MIQFYKLFKKKGFMSILILPLLLGFAHEKYTRPLRQGPTLLFSMDSIEPGFISRSQLLKVRHIRVTSNGENGAVIEYKIKSCSISNLFDHDRKGGTHSEHISNETNDLSDGARNILAQARGGDIIMIGNIVIEDVPQWQINKVTTWNVTEPGMADTDCSKLHITLDHTETPNITFEQLQKISVLNATITIGPEKKPVQGKVKFFHLNTIKNPENKRYNFSGSRGEAVQNVFNVNGSFIPEIAKKTIHTLKPGDMISFTNIHVAGPDKKTYNCSVTYKITEK